MKIKFYLFRFAIALGTFGFGAGLFYAWQNLSFAAQEEKTEIAAVQPPAQSEVVMSSPVAEIPVDETTPAPDLNESAEDSFNATGDYYLVDDAPKGFKDFESINITTNDYTNASEENNYWGTPIPPKGYLLTKKKYKFARINIGNKQIAFETEIRNEISYKFVGKFVDNVQSEDGAYADLEGRLVKMQNGKKIAESDIRLLVSCGC